jgi:hypothetical protein
MQNDLFKTVAICVIWITVASVLVFSGIFKSNASFAVVAMVLVPAVMFYCAGWATMVICQSSDEDELDEASDDWSGISGPVNLDFETETEAGCVPPHWLGGGGGYELAVDSEQVHSGKGSGRVRYIGPRAEYGFGTMTQCFSPVQFCGKRVRYSGYLRTEKVTDWAGMWMRVDGPRNVVLSFDNMQNRAIRGTTDWSQYEIQLDVPERAVCICLGFLLSGGGTVWGDDLKLEAV